MASPTLSTIAQLLCYQTLPLNFAKLIGEVDKILEQNLDCPFKVTWDCDNVASFDVPGSRILLAWSEAPGRGLSGVLTVSAGPSPTLGKPVMRPDYDAVTQMLVDDLSSRVGVSETLWHRMACHMSPEWVELLVDALPDRPDAPQSAPVVIDLQAVRTETKPRHVRRIQPTRAPMLELVQTTHRPSERAMPVDPDLLRLRAALYEDDDDARPSVHMRLAVHAMNATLIVVWLPLGAAAMIHGMVRGEDMRLASRLMVLTGSVGALMQTPMGQNVAALAGL